METNLKLFFIFLAISTCNGHIPLIGDIIASTSSRIHEVAGGIIGGITQGLRPKSESKQKEETIVIIVENENTQPGAYRPPQDGVNDRGYNDYRPNHNGPEIPYHHGNNNFNNNGNYNHGRPHNNDYNHFQGNIPNMFPNHHHQGFPNHERPRCPPNKYGISQNCGNNYGRPQHPHQQFGNNNGAHYGRPQHPQNRPHEFEPNNHNGNNNYERPHYPNHHGQHGYNNQNNNNFNNNEGPQYPPHQTGDNGFYDQNLNNNNIKPTTPNPFDNNNQEINNKYPDSTNVDQFNSKPTPELSTNQPVTNKDTDKVTIKPVDDIPLFVPLLPSDNDNDDKNAPKRDTEKDAKPVDDSDENFELDIRFKT